MPLPHDDPLQLQPDISLAKKKLNDWYPNINLNEGLGHTIEYFRNKLGL